MVTSIWIKLLLGSVSIGLTLYAVLCLTLYFVQKRLIFKPSRQIAYTPKEVELNYEDVWIPLLTPAETVERLHGWWIEGKQGKESVLLYLHGNGGNISSNLSPVQRFHELGFSVLMIDYRGYGRSDGTFPSEEQMYRDSQVTWDYLVQRRGVQPQNIFIFGHSMGGAVAIDLAVRKPNAAGVIVQSTFTSLQHLGGQQSLYRLFPIPLILTQRFDSLGKLPLLQIPLMLIHGIEDQTVPYTMSQTLYDRANVPKQLYLVPLAGHNNVSSVGDMQYKDEIDQFRDLATTTQRQFVSRMGSHITYR
ncbi:MAG: alpha/beta hydrolase [Microcystaceae cyanobacterium]